jgi:hypothetical protein
MSRFVRPVERVSGEGLRELLDEFDEFLAAVSVPAGQSQEFCRVGDDGASLWGAGDLDPEASAELKESFVAKHSQCSQHGVGVDAKYRRKVTGWWQSATGGGFPLGDGSADLGRDLIVQQRRVAPIDLDSQHSASHTSTNGTSGGTC